MRTPLLHALGRTHCPACMCCVGVVIVGQVSDTQALSVACHGVTDNTFFFDQMQFDKAFAVMNDERRTTSASGVGKRIFLNIVCASVCLRLYRV